MPQAQIHLPKHGRVTLSSMVYLLYKYLLQQPAYADFPKPELKTLCSPAPYEPGIAESRLRAKHAGVHLELFTRKTYSPNRDGAHLTDTVHTFTFSGYAPMNVHCDARGVMTMVGETEELERFLDFYYASYLQLSDAATRKALALEGKAVSLLLFFAQEAILNRGDRLDALIDLEYALTRLPEHLDLMRRYLELLYCTRWDRPLFVKVLAQYDALAPTDINDKHRRQVDYFKRHRLPDWKPSSS